MTLISWNGGPIFRNGAVGTEQACCCGGPPPPPPCESCPDCAFSTTPQYEEGASIECFGVGTLPSTKGLDVFNGLPPGGLPGGVSWKDGYPAALDGCEWAFVIDSLSIDCCYEDCIVNGVQQNVRASKTRNRYRILLLTCPDGPESAQVTDITDLAIEGDLEFENDNKPIECPNPPIACTEWLDYFPDPVPDCNEFP